MQLQHGIQLAYCTNIHPGRNWAETLSSLDCYALRVRDQVSPDAPFAIGLRLSDDASRELARPVALAEFKAWLRANDCYVFTINGFPYGQFHGTRVKERVYQPDWSTPERAEYTKRLFTILADLLEVAPPGCAGSVSTLPGSFKGFQLDFSQQAAMRKNLWECVDFIEQLSESSERDLHLGLEPEPLCWFENTPETVAYFEQLAAERPGDGRWQRYLGVNYDVCHLAVEYEDPALALETLRQHGIRLSKIHISSALRVTPTPAVREALRTFADEVYLHQVIARCEDGSLRRYLDLDDALNSREFMADAGSIHRDSNPLPELEWRVHFHVPLHMAVEGGEGLFSTTAEANAQVFAVLGADPTLCTHLEMETYTWGVLPAALRSRDVVEQLAAEYAWCLENLDRVGLRPVSLH